MSRLVECKTISELQEMMHTHVTPYWETHYTFGSYSPENGKNLSPFSINLLTINTAIPMLFAYGRHASKEELCDLPLTSKAETAHLILDEIVKRI